MAAKLLAAWLPAVGVALGSFLLYSVDGVLLIGGGRIFRRDRLVAGG